MAFRGFYSKEYINLSQGKMAILESARIEKSKIVNQAFANLYNLINNRSNVSDPVNPTDTGTTRSRKFVYSKMPNLNSRNFEMVGGFPFITVSRAMPRFIGRTVGLTKSFIDFDFMINVYTKDSSSDSTGYPKGIDQIQLITDDIIEALNDSSNRKTFIQYGLAGLAYDIETDEEQLEEAAVYTAEFDIRFENNLLATS